MWNRQVVWSPIEIEYLKLHRNDTPIDQLTISLAKSRNAITRKLQELDGKVFTGKKNKKSYIGKRPDLGMSFRSAWESNVARYFNYIKWKWLYEPKVFFFAGEKRGAISYLPDFYLPEYDCFVEVKGYISSRDRGTLRKFKKYYPTEFSKLKVITGSPHTQATKFFQAMGIEVIAFMNDLNKQYKDIISNWE